MGCCHSSPADPAAAEQHRANLDGAHSHSGPARENQPIRPPTPLPRPPKGVSRHQPPWTRSIFEDELRSFFETRQDGSASVWETLDEVARLVRRGRLQDAQTILDAANLTCPNGRIARTKSASTRGPDGQRVKGGIYDVRGHRYDLPNWVVREPADLIEDPPSAPEKNMDDGSDEDEEPSSQATAGQDKGKGRAQDPGEELQVKVRYNDLPQDAVFKLGSKQPVSILRAQIQQARGTENVRLVLTGKFWENSHLEKTLDELGWTSSMMINAFVTSQPPLD